MSTIDVQMASDCHGPTPPYAQLFDLSGNLHEWEDSCTESIGPNDTCRRRGGYWESDAADLRCDGTWDNIRSASNPNTGFRCCADL